MTQNQLTRDVCAFDKWPAIDIEFLRLVDKVTHIFLYNECKSRRFASHSSEAFGDALIGSITFFISGQNRQKSAAVRVALSAQLEFELRNETSS